MKTRDRMAAAIDRYVNTVALLALLLGGVMLVVAFWHL